MEGNNPAGSVKDRPAKYMFLKELESGAIDKSTQLIEPTSGNTGIALAMIASSLKMSLTLVMPESATIERVKTIKAYGAKSCFKLLKKALWKKRLIMLRKKWQ